MREADAEPRSVSGHPALDFVNTAVFADGDAAADVLRDPEAMLAWAAREALWTGATASIPDRTLIRDAVRLRASIRAAFEAIAAGGEPDPGRLGPIQEHAAEAVRRATPSFVGGRLVWEWPAATPHEVLWKLAASALDLLRAGTPERLKVCPGCGFLLVDATKNGRRRWCSMDDCGTQEKMRRYVARRAGRDAD